MHTLGDEYKPGYQKTAETKQLANQWEGSNAPIPASSQAIQQPPPQQEDNIATNTVRHKIVRHHVILNNELLSLSVWR